ncbi:unnamed protein product [Thelazia callipaeda]|uniref:Ovule protein n=1 Tax=Thelazia callipaeda TaxID=103827 RepID=A0A0N5CJT7_THECL|nr:unnamed protein product [Thelazia callipaeda]
MEEKSTVDGSLLYGKGRVKKLLEKFESSGSVHSAKINSSPTIRHRCKPILRHRSSKLTSVGTYQKRAILGRQSKSHTDVRSTSKSLAVSTTRRKNSLMSKSCSHGEYLSDQMDILTAIRAKNCAERFFAVSHNYLYNNR